jgi:hypothetical protein
LTSHSKTKICQFKFSYINLYQYKMLVNKSNTGLSGQLIHRLDTPPRGYKAYLVTLTAKQREDVRKKGFTLLPVYIPRP